MSAIDDMNLKFTSGNCIPVDRTIVTRDEWLAVVAELESLRQERDGLRADAVRYRAYKRLVFTNPMMMAKALMICNTQADIDAAIDAAMAKEQGDE